MTTFKHYNYDREKYSPSYFTNILQSIYKCSTPFEVVVTDLRPKTLLGCYIIQKHRIRIHVGWPSWYPLEEVAIHECAHHIHYTEKGKLEKGERPNGQQFRRIYSALVAKAIRCGIYNDHYIDILWGMIKLP